VAKEAGSQHFPTLTAEPTIPVGQRKVLRDFLWEFHRDMVGIQPDSRSFTWGQHPIATAQFPPYFQTMKQEHFFQSQRSADVRSPAQTMNSNQTKEYAQPSRDEVAMKAYLIYLNQGSPQGHDVQHWLEAEAQMIATPAPRTSGS
jgi:hypothetical protein